MKIEVSEPTVKLIERIQELLGLKRTDFESAIKAAANEFLDRKDPVRKSERYAMTAASRQPITSQRSANSQRSVRSRISADKSITPVSMKTGIGDRQVETPKATKTGRANASASKRRQIPFMRWAIPASVKHQVYLRDHGQCQFKIERQSKNSRADTNAENHTEKICGERRFVQIHHRIPVSHGGQNQLENLVTLCSGHHRAIHL